MLAWDLQQMWWWTLGGGSVITFILWLGFGNTLMWLGVATTLAIFGFCIFCCLFLALVCWTMVKLGYATEAEFKKADQQA